jgi:PAS domain S-box-containing protein
MTRVLLRLGRDTVERGLIDADLLRDMFEAAPDPQFIVAVGPGGEIRLAAWNAAARSHHGSAGALGCPFGDLLPASEGSLLQRGVEQAAAAGASLRIQIKSARMGVENASEATFIPLRARGTNAIRRVLVSLRDLGPSRVEDTAPPRPDHLTTEAGSAVPQGPEELDTDPDQPSVELVSRRVRSDDGPAEASLAPVQANSNPQRAADERLRESEARYRLLADYTSDLIVLDDASGRHLYISPAVTSMLGYTVEEANRMGLRTLVHREDIANLTAILHALGPEQPTGSVIYRMRHRSGQDLWVEAAFRRIQAQGETQVIQAIRDVTQRQRQEADLHSARIEAEAAVRAKAEFLATMSHELRTPLAGILGVHDLLQGDASLNQNQARLVGLAQEAGRSLLTIVNDILDVSKMEAGRLVIESLPFSLVRLIEGCRELSVEIAQGREVRIVTEIGPDVPDWVLGDPTRLRQVILNLTTNAIKFTPHGSVTMRAAWKPASDIGSRRRSALRIELVDTGIGIPEDALPHLFERFAQADGSISRRYGGTGLGLTICKRLVHLMGGEIGAYSQVGEGSTFWFEVPLRLAETENETERARLATLGRPSPQRWRILLAEDNSINQEIIGTVLRHKGHTVTVVDDGEQAVTAAFAAEHPDLILMDVQMPGLDGLAATQVIRARERLQGSCPMPIIALTANAMPEEMERCRAAGMDAHVAKPIEWPVLFATLERLAVRIGAADGEDRPLFTEERPAP